MKTALIHLRDQYQKKVDNIEWNLSTNREYYNKYDLDKMQERISEINGFIWDLNQLIIIA